jgi:hypothetical protein
MKSVTTSPDPMLMEEAGTRLIRYKILYCILMLVGGVDTTDTSGLTVLRGVC